MFVHNLLAICDGDDMSKESIAFTFDFRRALKWLLPTAPAGNVDRGMAHYIPMAY